MERFLSLVALCSQSYTSDRKHRLIDLLKNQSLPEKISYFDLKDIVICIGNVIAQSGDLTSANEFDTLLSFSVVLFKKAIEFKETTPDTLLKRILDDIIEPLAKTSKSALFQIILKLLNDMLEVVCNSEIELIGRFDVLTTLNLILSGVQSPLKRKIWRHSDLKASISNFGASLSTLGDFDLQAHAAALLLRLIPHEHQHEFALIHVCPRLCSLAKQFPNIGGINFEFNIRPFLNSLNQNCKVNPKVVSLPCEFIRLCELVLEYPVDPNGNEKGFWLDFNLSTNRITVYCLAPYNEQSTQYSGCITQAQRNWEILTIYPESLDCLDIQMNEDIITLQFTTAEPIRDMCDWAPSVSGTLIECKIPVNALTEPFYSMKFTSISPSSKGNEANLVHIIQQIQSFRKHIDSQRISEWSLNTSDNHYTIASSPLSINTAEKNNRSKNKVIPEKSFNKIFGSQKSLDLNTTSLAVIASSPLVCNNEKPIMFLQSCKNLSRTLNNQVSNSKTQEELNDVLEQILSEESENSKVNVHGGTHECNEKPDHSDESITLLETNNQDFLHCPKNYHTSPYCNVDLDEYSPEKQRRAPVKVSPVTSLKIEKPQIKELTNQNRFQSPKLIQLNYANDFISRTPEEFVDKLSSASSSVHGSQLLCISQDIQSQLTVKEFLGPVIQLHDIEESDNSKFREKTNISSDLPKSQIDGTNAFITSQFHSQKIESSLSLLSCSENNKIGQKKPALMSPVTFKSDSSHQSPDENNSTLFRSPKYNALQPKVAPTRRLCDISASYLLDISPVGIQGPFTPEDGTVVLLPKLSTQVKLKGASKNSNRTKSTNLTKRKRDLKSQNMDKSSSENIVQNFISSDILSSQSSNSNGDSDSDYRPGPVIISKTNCEERRKSLRSAHQKEKKFKLNTDSNPSFNSSMSNCSRISDSSHNNAVDIVISPTHDIPLTSGNLMVHNDNKSSLSKSNRTKISDSQNISTFNKNLMITPVQQPSLIKAVSTLKKKKFFCSTRLERLEKEKRRFQEACKVNKPPNNKKTNKCKKPTISLQCKPPSNLPALSQVLNIVNKPEAMPIDSDLEFEAEILDSQFSLVNSDNVLGKQTHKNGSTRSSDRKFVCPISENKNEKFDQASSNACLEDNLQSVPITPFVNSNLNSPADNFSSDHDDKSSVLSLFAMTPPAKLYRRPHTVTNNFRNQTKHVPLNVHCSHENDNLQLLTTEPNIQSEQIDENYQPMNPDNNINNLNLLDAQSFQDEFENIHTNLVGVEFKAPLINSSLDRKVISEWKTDNEVETLPEWHSIQHQISCLKSEMKRLVSKAYS